MKINFISTKFLTHNDHFDNKKNFSTAFIIYIKNYIYINTILINFLAIKVPMNGMFL